MSNTAHTTTSLYSIQHLPATERPRERLLKHGSDAMTVAELIAIILGSGMKGMPVLQLAQEIIARFGADQQLADATIEELCTIKGLGMAKALQLKAALSLGVRVAKNSGPRKVKIDGPEHAYQAIKEQLEHEPQELVAVLLLDVKCNLICNQIVAVGTLSNALVHPREIFYPAIRHHASSLILAHNHPSGDPTPSKQDIELTEALVESGQLIGIPINDHIIIGKQKYVSLRQHGVKFN